MTELYLHIGTEKTGTTSIQRFLRANRELLASNGILFPTAPGNQNHIGLAAAAHLGDKPGPWRNQLGLRSAADIKAFRTTLKHDLENELRARPYTGAIMSGEHCSSRLIENEEIGRLRDLLADLFDPIHIVVYLRRQDDYLISTYSTKVKSGSTRPLSMPSSETTSRRYDHWALLDRWMSVFGRERIVCRRFEKASFVGGSLIQDFLDAARVPTHLPFDYPPTMNESLDASALEFLRLFNRHFPRAVTDDPNNQMRNALISILYEMSQGPLLTLPEEDLHAFMQQFAESNRRVAQEFFGGARTGSGDPLFVDRTDARDRTTVSNLTADRAIQICAALWDQSPDQEGAGRKSARRRKKKRKRAGRA